MPDDINTLPTDEGTSAVDDNLDASAFDRALLSSHALDAIHRIWGENAKRRNLLEPDAFHKIRRCPGAGAQSLEQIASAVIAWGFDGLGGKRAWDEETRKGRARGKRTLAPRAAGKQALTLVLEAVNGKTVCPWCASELATQRHAGDCRATSLMRAIGRRYFVRGEE